ncbi:hypothetical protein M5689_008970 [Euphorbia peplus]|nr:hypothetical protein M5689_008970 [Euphorbia peplus]
MRGKKISEYKKEQREEKRVSKESAWRLQASQCNSAAQGTSICRHWLVFGWPSQISSARYHINGTERYGKPEDICIPVFIWWAQIISWA